MTEPVNFGVVSRVVVGVVSLERGCCGAAEVAVVVVDAGGCVVGTSVAVAMVCGGAAVVVVVGAVVVVVVVCLTVVLVVVVVPGGLFPTAPNESGPGVDVVGDGTEPVEGGAVLGVVPGGVVSGGVVLLVVGVLVGGAVVPGSFAPATPKEPPAVVGVGAAVVVGAGLVAAVVVLPTCAVASLTGERARAPQANVIPPSANKARRVDCRQWAVVFDLKSSPRSAVPGNRNCGSDRRFPAGRNV
jgi:hypothetical protein